MSTSKKLCQLVTVIKNGKTCSEKNRITDRHIKRHDSSSIAILHWDRGGGGGGDPYRDPWVLRSQRKFLRSHVKVLIPSNICYDPR